MLDRRVELGRDHLQESALGCLEVGSVQLEHAARADGDGRHPVVAGRLAVGHLCLAVDEEAHTGEAECLAGARDDGLQRVFAAEHAARHRGEQLRLGGRPAGFTGPSGGLIDDEAHQ